MRTIFDRPVFLIGAFLGLILAINEFRFETSMPFGGDFSQIWVGGVLFNTGSATTLYSQSAFSAAGLALIENFYRPMAYWSYPPTALVIGSPLAFLPYHAALAVFTSSQVLLASWTGIEVLRSRATAFWSAMILIVSPALFLSVVFGQFSAPIGCLLVLGVFALDKRPVLAGVLFGLTALKPQFGLLLPLALVIAGAWRAFFAAAATVIVLSILPAIVFGAGIWLDFIAKTLPQQANLIGDLAKYGPVAHSVRDTLLLAGLPRSAATAAQILASCIAIAATASAFRRTTDAPLRAFVLTLAATALLPYANLYDAAIPAIGALALYGSSRQLHPAMLAALMVIWLSPVVDAFFGVYHLFKFAPVFEIGVLAYLLYAFEKAPWQNYLGAKKSFVTSAA